MALCQARRSATSAILVSDYRFCLRLPKSSVPFLIFVADFRRVR